MLRVSIISITFHAIHGAVCIQLTNLSYDDCENMSSSNWKYEPFAIVYRVRSWNNGTSIYHMSFYVYMNQQEMHHVPLKKQSTTKLQHIPWGIWGLCCQKQVSHAGISNYIPQLLWDVITYPCMRYLLLATKSSYRRWPWDAMITQHPQQQHPRCPALLTSMTGAAEWWAGPPSMDMTGCRSWLASKSQYD